MRWDNSVRDVTLPVRCADGVPGTRAWATDRACAQLAHLDRSDAEGALSDAAAEEVGERHTSDGDDLRTLPM